jgi:hypothetical protein
MIPERSTSPPAAGDKQPFVWNQDATWQGLEQQFVQARTLEPAELAGRVDSGVAAVRRTLEVISGNPLNPEDPAFAELESELFQLAPLVGACPDRSGDFAKLLNRVRREVKDQSIRWDLNSSPARQRLYRLLHSSRLALEEILLQAPAAHAPPALIEADPEPSATPAARVGGLAIHSGDILVSRGGAPTSALIARGNDFPGSFSHAALAHVDPATRRVTMVESLIECGLTFTDVEKYLRDKKLRIMVLRLRADLPALRTDPLLPHKAAARALVRAQEAHVPYDFAMDFQDHRTEFCSEVVSAAFEQEGIRLWQGLSFISSPTVRAWLASVGVRHFETQEPAELEYDPHLRVVAEWRDPETLLKAHVDDAVTDVMLTEAKPGAGLPYPILLLPVARLIKAYSVGLNYIGKVGPVPEGMSATVALRVRSYRREHAARAQRLLALAREFEASHGYRPLYWELVRLARLSRN